MAASACWWWLDRRKHWFLPLHSQPKCNACIDQVACGGDHTLAVCQHEVRDAEARGAADRRLLGSWYVCYRQLRLSTLPTLPLS